MRVTKLRVFGWALIAACMVALAGGGYAFGTSSGSITAKRVLHLPTSNVDDYQPVGKVRGFGKVEAYCNDTAGPPGRLVVKLTNTTSKEFGVSRVEDAFGVAGDDDYQAVGPNGTDILSADPGAVLEHYHIFPSPQVATGSKPQIEIDLSGTTCPDAMVAMMVTSTS